MEHLIGYIATGAVSLVVGVLLIYFQPKSKVFYWSPHTFLFNLKKENVLLQTDSLTIQNLGRKSASNIEVIFDTKPDFYQLQPAAVHDGVLLENGNFAVKLKELGPKEFYTFQVLSYTKVPKILNVRSDSGQASFMPFQLQRLYPRWFNVLLTIFLVVGASTCAYWLIKLGYSIYCCVSGDQP